MHHHNMQHSPLTGPVPRFNNQHHDSHLNSHGHVRDDVSLMSDGGQSRAESVASEALDAILTRIEDCKVQLATGPESLNANDIAKQVEVAGLIEKLASAAVAVKKLEGL